MLVASAVLPMPGRPARMIRSEGCRPPILRVEIGQTGRQAGQAAVALIGVRRHVDRGGERLGEALEAAIVAAGLGEFVELALGVLDVALRRRVDRRVVGEVDHVLADRDQIAADREIVDGAAVILGIDDRRRLGGEPRQILIDRQAGDVEVRRQERLQRHRRRDLAGADQPAGKLENALVDRLEEMLRLEEVGDAVERLVIDEDGAEQRLLGLDIVRRRAERRFRGSLLACGRIESGHGPDQRNRVWPICGSAEIWRRANLRSLNIADHSTTAAPVLRIRAAMHASHARLSIVQRRAHGKSSLRLSPLPTAPRRNAAADSALDARFSAADTARLLAGKAQRRGLAGFERAQSRFLARDVIARRRHDALALGHLDLEHHHVALAERHLGGGQVELPHAHEALIVEPHDLVAMGEEALAPGLERLGIVELQDFDVGDDQVARARSRGSTSESAGM